ncbi:MAG: putative rhomboid protease [Bathelium mastoideum]|nr:MAG: putative rhomboid protease [Bathelium mastoideum]
MAQPSWQVNPARIRSYVNKIPLGTRLLVFAVLFISILSQRLPSLRNWGCLLPAETNLATLNRLSTYPFFHLSLLHLILNIIALIPLLTTFESENGTIVTLLLFTGPFSLLPGLLYTGLTLLTHLSTTTTVCGSSIWIFLLLSSTAYTTSRTHPHFALPITSPALQFPVWASPLCLALLIWIFVPGTSLLGHLCGCAVGFGWGAGVLRLLAPPERPLRWIEGKLNLLGRLPHYVSIDQKIYGRYGVLPSMNEAEVEMEAGTGRFRGTGPAGQRLGP